MNDGSRSRLTRSSDRTLGGVAGGLADYFEIDPTLMRVIFVLAFFLGFGAIVLAYIVLWIIMPEAEAAANEQPMASATGGGIDSTMVLGGILIVVGAIMLMNRLAVDLWLGFGALTWAWPIILVVAGVWLVMRARDRTLS